MNSDFQLERVNYIFDIFNHDPHLFDHSQVPLVRAKGSKIVLGELPLNNHIVHGETILSIHETLEEGEIKKFRYTWELSQRKKRMSKNMRFITSFDKQPHPDPPYNVDTDPYHHHYDTNNPIKRTETDVEDLYTIVSILRDYIISNQPYKIEDRYYEK
ncbi:toxin-antitoxin system TumE family protein [Priestia megaterium]|uniref:toxin-antitoxin system TumE family protein n=1 Tax=Priestia megaterium TaxID=1404 RepID=UPI003D07A621